MFKTVNFIFNHSFMFYFKSLISFFFLFSILSCNKNSPSGLIPSPSFSAEEVVKIQLEAFKNNTELDDHQGIRQAFRFASPANQDYTGPEDHFVAMMNADKYSGLLNANDYIIEKIFVEDNMAHFRVTIKNRKLKDAVFIFVLSKQKDNDFQDCWMTDSVVSEDEENSEAEGISA